MLTIDGLDIFQSLVSANKYAYIYTTKKKQDNNVPQKKGNLTRKKCQSKLDMQSTSNTN